MRETVYQKIDRLQAERDSARRELEQLKKDRERLLMDLIDAACGNSPEVLPSIFNIEMMLRKELAATRKAIDAAMRKETK